LIDLNPAIKIMI